MAGTPPTWTSTSSIAGGPRILDDLSYFLDVDPAKFAHSRATLVEYGNIASAVVLDALRRLFIAGVPDGAQGIVAGFGPGITAEISLGSWINTPAIPVANALTSTIKETMS